MVPFDLQIGPPPLPPSVDYLSSVMLGDFLMAEAEAQDGNVEIVDALGVILVLPVG